jgi:predicted nucleotidyltransferase
MARSTEISYMDSCVGTIQAIDAATSFQSDFHGLGVSGRWLSKRCHNAGTDPRNLTAAMPPTPYRELNEVLSCLVLRQQENLGKDLVGVYLQGSFAVGGFDLHSDVDLIFVVEDELSPGQVDALQEMHDQIYRLESKWAQHLEGSYFPKEILRHHSKRGIKLWYLDHGARVLIRSSHCNTILVRWVVREKGVTLIGLPPDTLVDPISAELLRKEVLGEITGWGQEILDNPARFNNRFYQGFIVLNYCRMLHDLKRGCAGSKREGAEWAKANLDPSWRGLIDRTWSCRPTPEWQVKQPADPEDFAATLKFVEYIIEQSKHYPTDS